MDQAFDGRETYVSADRDWHSPARGVTYQPLTQDCALPSNHLAVPHGSWDGPLASPRRRSMNG